MPSKVIKNLSPFEKLFSKKPDYSTLKVFGCLCYSLIRPYNKHKLDFRSVKATFLGYSHSHKGYKVLLPDGRVLVTRDVIFDELTFPYQSVSPIKFQQNPISALGQLPCSSSSPILISNIPPSPSVPPSPAILHHSDQVPSTSNTDLDHSASHHSPQTSHSSFSGTSYPDSPLLTDPQPDPPTQKLQPTHHMTTRSKAGVLKPKIYSLSLSPYLIPRSAFEALLIPIWKAAMLAEFIALLKNKTWFLTTLPPGKNLIGCTWVFKLKFHLSGAIAVLKVLLNNRVLISMKPSV